MNDLQFRPATREDYDTVFDLFSEVQLIHASRLPNLFKAPTKDTHFQAFFDRVMCREDLYLTLGCAERLPVGYVHYSTGTQSEDIYQLGYRYSYIEQLVVREAYRSHGYGRAFLEHVRLQSRSLGISRIGIDFWSFNEPARRCFTGAGYRVFQEFMWLDT